MLAAILLAAASAAPARVSELIVQQTVHIDAEFIPTAAHVRELIAHDQWKEALGEARSLIEDFKDPDAVTALGEALYRAGLIDEAGEALQPVVAADDPPARALAQLGLVRAAQGKDAEALTLMERAVSKAPRDPWVVYHASGATRTRAQAVGLLETYVETAPGDDPDRLEGARGSIRLSRALGERKVWNRVRTPAHLELPLKPLTGTGGGYFVEATLANRKKIRLLLDTGSTGLFVVLRAVKKGGLSLLSDETVFAGGNTGRTPSSRGLLATLSLGELEIEDALVTTTTDEFDPQGRIHGVLGLNVFDGYRVTLDFPRQKLILSLPGDEFQSSRYWDVGGQMLVQASASAVHDGLFLFDTGAVRSMVGRSFANSVPGAQVEHAADVRTYGGNVAGAASVRGVKLRLSGFTVDGGGPMFVSDLTQRSRLGGVEISGFVGMDLLDKSKIVIDTVRHVVAVEKN